MKKKFLIVISSILCFVGLAFLITMRHSMPVLALGNVSIQDNDTFSNDILIDMDYYNSLDPDSDNLFNPKDYVVKNGWIEGGNKDYNLYHFKGVVGKTYTIKSFDFNIQVIKFANDFGESGGTEGPQNWTPFTTWTFTLTNHNTFILKYNNQWYHTDSPRIMIVEGSTSPSTYESYYKNMFGFSVHFFDSTSYLDLPYIETIGIYNYYYLPFDISENGKVSFNYTFNPNVEVSFNRIIINNKINGVVNNKLKLQYYYSNFSVGFKSISFIDSVAPAETDWMYGLMFQSDLPRVEIKSGKHSVYYSNWKSEIYNFISQDDFMDHYEYLEYVQVLGFGSSPGTGQGGTAQGGTRTISFESLVCSSFGSGGGTYIPDNSSNDYESYLPVSGPFDLVPILSNAFTWIIFNVPIIGPVLNVLRSVRVMFTSVVSIGQLFTGFGVIFSIFIVCLILYIIKHLNGGD